MIFYKVITKPHRCHLPLGKTPGTVIECRRCHARWMRCIGGRWEKLR